MQTLKVLILENNPFQLMMLHKMLNAFRIFDVLTAESVDSARNSLTRRGAIDVAICNLHMEEESGLELISELALKRNGTALIILGAASPGVVEKAASMARMQGIKVLGCLPRPVVIGRLAQLLDSYQKPLKEMAGSAN